MPPAFVLSQDQTLRLTRTIQQPGSRPSHQTIQANEDPHQTRFRQANHDPGRTPQALTQKRRSRNRRRPNQEHAKLRQQALTRCRRPRIPSYITNNVKKRHNARLGRPGLDARPDRVEERAYTPAVRGLSIQLMTLFRRPAKPRNIRVFRLLYRSRNSMRRRSALPAPRVIKG